MGYEKNLYLHTNGPWHHHKSPLTGGDTLHVIQAGKLQGVTICTIRAGLARGNSDRVDSVCDKNASVIAAAPELLAALSAIVEVLEQRGGTEFFRNEIGNARNAIAKAKGEINV